MSAKPDRMGRLPCPFCGSARLRFDGMSDADEARAWVVCEPAWCRATGPAGDGPTEERAHEKAVELWNRARRGP